MFLLLGKIYNQVAYKIIKRRVEEQEIEQASLLLNRLEKLISSGNDTFDIIINKANSIKISKEIYSELHSAGTGYTKNNWGFDLLKYNHIFNYTKVFELGSGNGKFIDHLNANGFSARGLDLINPTKSDFIDTRPITELNSKILSEYEIAISADFMEHLNITEIDSLLNKQKESKIASLNIIACYDDFISHTSVYEPHEWALLYKKYFKNVRILDIIFRRQYFKKKAVIIYADNY